MTSTPCTLKGKPNSYSIRRYQPSTYTFKLLSSSSFALSETLSLHSCSQSTIPHPRNPPFFSSHSCFSQKHMPILSLTPHSSIHPQATALTGESSAPRARLSSQSIGQSPRWRPLNAPTHQRIMITACNTADAGLHNFSFSKTRRDGRSACDWQTASTPKLFAAFFQPFRRCTGRAKTGPRIRREPTEKKLKKRSRSRPELKRSSK
ncbi:hypothetical protein V8C37DRAFT_58043 [Trichoderma ceciliae]